VAGEQAGGVTDRFGRQREGGHWSGGFHGGSNRVEWSDGGGAEEQPRASAQRSQSGGEFGWRSWR
jgi:hypothetical protein